MMVFIIGILALLISAAVISYPLFYGEQEPYLLEDLPDESYSEKDATLDALSELELSYQSGKLPEDIYQVQKAKLQKQYIQVVEDEERAQG
ncbi:MAG: hypothetical protein OEZ59_04785 [Deltaproteobacteria bacterium]|nr:hypothetical protein [Deltaproteobacteria bacterium]